jgi:aspartate racemase
MGPAATAEFYAKLIARTPAERDQDHLPVAIWADPRVPDRVAAVIDGSTDPYPAMLNGALRLRDIGATLVAVPCHTAHFFLPRLIEDSGLPFVDMVAETVGELLRGPMNAAGLLGTRATIQSGLYQNRLHEADFDVAVPDEPLQQQVDLAIKKVKQGDTMAAAEHLGLVVRELSTSAVVLACTELPLAVPFIPGPCEVDLIDPTVLLADAVIRECR